MVSKLRIIFIVGRYRWVASIATTSVCLVCCIPQIGVCYVSNDSKITCLADRILDKVDSNDSETVKKNFDKLESNLKNCQDPIAEGERFFRSFIDELNARYRFSLTTQEAYRLVRENLHILQLPVEAQNALLRTVELLESDSGRIKSQEQNVTMDAKNFYWPNEWNWFGLNKKKKNHSSKTAQSNPRLTEIELPGNCYVGGCELLAGALLFILPIPGSTWLGTFMLGDGVRRLADGIVQISDERRVNPNHVPPQPPF